MKNYLQSFKRKFIAEICNLDELSTIFILWPFYNTKNDSI